MCPPLYINKFLPLIDCTQYAVQKLTSFGRPIPGCMADPVHGSRYCAKHAAEMDSRTQPEVALCSAREALQILAGHGHQFYLAPGSGETFPEWPKRLFHVDQAPNGRQVFSQQDAEDLGPGWFDSFQKAQFWDGMETQFNGRGGVPKSPRVPAVPVAELNILTTDHDDYESRKQLIAAFRALNSWERPQALEIVDPLSESRVSANRLEAKPELAKDSEIEERPQAAAE